MSKTVTSQSKIAAELYEAHIDITIHKDKPHQVEQCP